jgi:hypothetical protein
MVVNDNDVKVAISIQVTSSQSSAQMGGLEAGSSGSQAIDEPSVPFRAAPD